MVFKRLASLSGKGRLLGREEHQFGAVDYSLEVFATTHLKAGTGSLAAVPPTIVDAFHAPQIFLELETGERVEIVITGASALRADFKTSGPVPGY